MKKALILAIPLLLPLPGWGQKPQADASVADDFPALQFLPPGSVIEGISIPRYENHRVSALLMSDKLEVLDRKTVILEKLNAVLYGEDNSETRVKTDSVTYSFATKLATTSGNAKVEDSRFQAEGKGVIFNTSSSKGFLHGPVKTIIKTATLTEKKGQKK